MVTAVAGLLMFGDDVRDEITSNILLETSYPKALTFLMCIFVAIIPLTKIPLNARPIISTGEVLLGLSQQTVADTSGLVGRSSSFRGIMKILIRVSTILVFLVIAIIFPAFDSIMAFMGSALCFTICVTYASIPPRSASLPFAQGWKKYGKLTKLLHRLPLAFYLKLFGSEIAAKERCFAMVIMCISAIMSLVGTVWAFLPKSLIGAGQ